MREVWETLVSITKDQVNEAEKQAHDKKFDQANAALGELQKAKTLLQNNQPSTEKSSLPADLKTRIDEVTKLVDQSKRRYEFVQWAQTKLTPPTSSSITDVVTDANRKGFASDPDVIGLLIKGRDELRNQIVFTEDPKPAERVPAGSEMTSLLIGGAAGQITPGEKVVFALARGVIYALAESDGRNPLGHARWH